MGMGMAATWPTRKREKKKARMAEGEKNIVAGRTDERMGSWRFLEGWEDSRCELGRTCGLLKGQEMKESGRRKLGKYGEYVVETHEKWEERKTVTVQQPTFVYFYTQPG